MFVLLAAAVLVWRRPDQFLNPYIWVEEGTVTLPAYLMRGWFSLFEPVAGYIVLPAKLIFFSAASLSFSHLPRVEYWLTLIFEVGTLALIAFSPSRLRMPALCALAVACVPTDGEIFAVSEYAFWWGSLWSFVAIFWDDRERESTAWRCVLAMVGGLSSPMALPAAAIFAVRAAINRRRADLIVLSVAIVTALAQAVTMYNAGVLGGGSLSGVSVLLTVERYFGGFAVAWADLSDNVVTALGATILGGGLLYVLLRKKWRDPWFIMLGALLVASILAAVARMPPHLTNPFNAGPRYYFFPYIFLAWALIYAAAELPWAPRITIGVVLACAMIQFGMYGSRTHDRISWRAELRSCSAAGSASYPLKVHFNGEVQRAWSVQLRGVDCDEMLDRSLFH